MDHSPSNADQQTEIYLRLLAQNDRWLATYVYSLVNDRGDADEILQDCKVAMWKNFGKFEPGSNFRAWARKFATHHVLNYRRSEQRRPHTIIDDQFIEAVAGEIDRRAGVLDGRADALHVCLKKLPDAHRRIIIWRYYEDCGIEEIASKTQRSVEAVYRLLSRIRTALNDCVSQQLSLSKLS